MMIVVESLPSFDFDEFGQYMLYHKYYDFINFRNYKFQTVSIKEQIEELKEQYRKLKPVLLVYKSHPEKHIIVTGYIPYIIAHFIYELPNEFTHFDLIDDLSNLLQADFSIFFEFETSSEKTYLKRYKILQKQNFFNEAINITTLSIPEIANIVSFEK